MSRKYATPLHLEIGPSRMLGYWLILVHSAPILMLPVLPLTGWLSLAVVAAVLCSLARSWRRQVGCRHPGAVCSMVWGEGIDCQLELCSGRQETVSLCPQAFILPWLVIIHFHSRQRHLRYLVLLPDMLDREAFRKLRVRMKLEINRP